MYCSWLVNTSTNLNKVNLIVVLPIKLYKNAVPLFVQDKNGPYLSETKIFVNNQKICIQYTVLVIIICPLGKYDQRWL